MAKVLNTGGFATEALVPIREAMEIALHALVLWQGHDAETPLALGLIDSTLVQTNLLPVDTLSLVAQLREDQRTQDDSQSHKLLAHCDSLLSQSASLLTSAKET